MSDSKLALLQQAASLTEEMLHQAEASEWSELASKQEQRAALLADIFPLPDYEQTESSRQLILGMIDHNQKLETLCRQGQQALQLELRGLNKNRKAMAAYQSS
jgi:hypothetical protein